MKNFMSVLKTKLNNEANIASEKTENKIFCNKPEKIWDQFIIRLGKN